MAEKKESPSMFARENYMWMAAGVVVIAIGMFLMSGGRSNVNPAVFDAKEVYSFTRITVAPIMILAGLVIEIFAIFRNPKSSKG
jgi:FtsH-binding integral membrane protein